MSDTSLSVDTDSNVPLTILYKLFLKVCTHQNTHIIKDVLNTDFYGLPSTFFSCVTPTKHFCGGGGGGS